jgi:hypothetical protein
MIVRAQTARRVNPHIDTLASPCYTQLKTAVRYAFSPEYARPLKRGATQGRLQ